MGYNSFADDGSIFIRLTVVTL